MKTSEEIKKGLECCTTVECEECPYAIILETKHEKIVLGCEETVTQDAVAYIQQLEEQVPRWISVKERQPTYEEETRCRTVKVRYDYRPGCYTEYDAFYSVLNDTWSIYSDSFGHEELPVTHWLWLPEIPEPEEVQHETD